MVIGVSFTLTRTLSKCKIFASMVIAMHTSVVYCYKKILQTTLIYICMNITLCQTIYRDAFHYLQLLSKEVLYSLSEVNDM